MVSPLPTPAPVTALLNVTCNAPALIEATVVPPGMTPGLVRSLTAWPTARFATEATASTVPPAAVLAVVVVDCSRIDSARMLPAPPSLISAPPGLNGGPATPTPLLKVPVQPVARSSKDASRLAESWLPEMTISDGVSL